MIVLPVSVLFLTIFTILIYLGLGREVLDRLRLTDSTALVIIILMIIGHFLPTVTLSNRLAVNLGALIPLGVIIYLLSTTSPGERQRAILISVLTGLFVIVTDRLLPPDPGMLDPIFSGGIFAGLLAYFWGKSRRSAFIGGMLGVLLADLVALVELWKERIPQQIVLGSGGLFSSVLISPFLALLIAEVLGEIVEFFVLKAGGCGGDNDE